MSQRNKEILRKIYGPGFEGMLDPQIEETPMQRGILYNLPRRIGISEEPSVAPTLIHVQERYVFNSLQERPLLEFSPIPLAKRLAMAAEAYREANDLFPLEKAA